ncbi:MAG: hypothetical protein FK734_00735 [Asgard group archaeon]|nr:hypothetical protein [Asgard group archaeon]
MVKSLSFEVYFDYLLGYDNYLFFIDQDDIAHIIDISNRELPVVITTYDFPLTIDLAKISGDYLYATTGSTLFPFDIHNPLQIIAKVPINFSPANILNFIINGNIAFCYTSFQSGSIYLINLMNPEYPSVLYAHEGFYSTDTSSTVGIAMINSTLYLSLYSNGWISVDFLDLSLPVVIQHHYADTPLDFVIQDQLAFIEYYDLGFKIYNISNFLEPKFIGSFYHDNYRSHLVVNGNYSYFYVSTEGLVIYNITNLKDPTQIGQYNPLMSILEIHQKNDYLLLKGYTTIHFVNISDPTNPQLLGEPFEIGVSTIALSEIYNDLLFLAYYYHPSYYINVYNISSYDNVTFLSTIDFLSIPLDINVHNDTLYILDIYDTRTYSYNITDVYNPLENGLLVMNENYNGINSIIENDFYYIYNTFNTLISYKIETNGNLTIYGTMDLFEIDESHQIIEGTVTNSYPIYITSDYLVITGLDSDFDHLADYLEITVYGTNHLSNDSDNDLISDYYEIHYSLDPLNATDAGLDFDGDTLTNYQEYLINTDPNDPDTDGDLLRDDEELLYNTDPNDPDTDGEGLSDYDEIYLYFTDPLNPDSDSDGLNDNYEVVLSHTNPNNSDTDGDTMSDYYEVYNGLNPLLDDRFLDTDLDGINNYDEYLLGTKPNDSDSDNDGYTDLEEINAGTDPLDRDDYPEEILYSTITSPVSWYVFGPTAVVFLLLLFRKFTATKKSSNRRND